MFYTDHLILSYKRLYNIIVGERGVGKTFNFTRRGISEGIKTKQKSFVWIRRYEADIDDIKGEFTKDMEANNIFPDYSFDVIKGNIIARNHITQEKFVIGELIALSLYQRKKSKPRPYVKYIVFDEFIAEDGSSYLDNEVYKFLNLCDTIIRHRNDVRVFLLGNAISMVNPYFDYFKIRDLSKNFTKGKFHVVENCDYQIFREMRRGTAFGKSVVGTIYGDYSIDNKFLLDDTTDVQPKPRGSETLEFNLLLNGKLIMVSSINNLYYIARGRDTTFRTYTPYVDDAKSSNAIFIDGRNNILKNIVQMFLDGRILYQSLQVKNEIQMIVRKIKKGF